LVFAVFVSVNRCICCHNSNNNGNGYVIWKKTKHAFAFETLKSEKAVLLARKVGLDSQPHQSRACLVSYVTGALHPEARENSLSFRKEVQCESCHGPGSIYRKGRNMKALHREYLQSGIQLSGKMAFSHGNKGTCTNLCHPPSITIEGKTYMNYSYKEFIWHDRLKKIGHLAPE